MDQSAPQTLDKTAGTTELFLFDMVSISNNIFAVTSVEKIWGCQQGRCAEWTRNPKKLLNS